MGGYGNARGSLTEILKMDIGAVDQVAATAE
jgi:hypothetical protein